MKDNSFSEEEDIYSKSEGKFMDTCLQHQKCTGYYCPTCRRYLCEDCEDEHAVIPPGTIKDWLLKKYDTKEGLRNNINNSLKELESAYLKIKGKLEDHKTSCKNQVQKYFNTTTSQEELNIMMIDKGISPDDIKSILETKSVDAAEDVVKSSYDTIDKETKMKELNSYSNKIFDSFSQINQLTQRIQQLLSFDN